MKSLSPSATTVTISNNCYSFKILKTHSQTPSFTNLRFPISQTHKNPPTFSLTCSNSFSIKACAASPSTPRHWMVLMETPPQGVISKQQVIEYYVKTVHSVMGKWVSFKFCLILWNCLALQLNYTSMLASTVRRMLRCVYMMLLGTPISAFAVMLIMKLPRSLHVKLLSFLLIFSSIAFC